MLVMAAVARCRCSTLLISCTQGSQSACMSPVSPYRHEQQHQMQSSMLSSISAVCGKMTPHTSADILGACSDQPALAVEAKAAAATLLMQMGQLHMQQQAREGSAPAAPLQPEDALQCFREAAARVQPFGESMTPTNVEVAVPACAD